MYRLNFQNEKLRILRDDLTLFERNRGYQSQFSFSHILIYLRRWLLPSCFVFAKIRAELVAALCGTTMTSIRHHFFGA